MSNYQLNEDKMFADITDGIAIVINSETGIYYGMNNLGTAVFENLIKGVSTENIVSALKALPNAPKNIEESFRSFLEAVVNKELIITDDANNASADFSSVEADDFSITVSEYNDAQELLLADPIHEVKEDTGWTPEKSALNTDKEDVARREAKAK